MSRKRVYSVWAAILSLVSCRPAPDPPEPRVAVGSQCAFIAIACYDEFARQPIDLICFRPRTRWPRIDLTYRLASLLPGLDEDVQFAAVDRAFALWASVSALSFTRVAAGADINITFVQSSHGDPFPFDGPGGILAHAFFPGSEMPGAIHISVSEDWADPAAEGQFDLFTVVLHEIGHAIGIEHSTDGSAVMAPSYAGRVMSLTQADISAVRRLYGSADGNVQPAPVAAPASCGAPANLAAFDDPDSDGDGLPDTIEVFVLGSDPFNGDTNTHGVDDFEEVFVLGNSPTVAGTDTDGDGLPDHAEQIADSIADRVDTDGDTLTDGDEVNFYGTSPTSRDTDGDGFDDSRDPFPTNPLYPVDCNGNVVADVEELATGAAADCNANGVPDDCDIAAGTAADCNANVVPDACEIDDDTDCNGNSLLDECDLAAGLAKDCNDNGVPDACDLADGVAVDCNTNHVPDECDLASGAAADCNGNAVPDGCDLSSGSSTDCDASAVPDECDIAAGSATDCNFNGAPDRCDLSEGTSTDCEPNGVPDECDIADGAAADCNSNGKPDTCDVAGATSEDCNGNGVPDECEPAQVAVDCAITDPAGRPSPPSGPVP